MRRALLAGAALLLLVAARGPAGEWVRRTEVGIGAGRSSNVFLQPEDGRSGFYVPWRVETDWRRPFGEGHRFRLSLDADGDWFPDGDLSAGDELSVDLEGRWDWRVRERPRARWDLTLKADAGYDRDLLVRRSNGEEFLHEGELGPVSLRDRYIARKYGVEVELERHAGPARFRASLDASRRDYVNDYRDVPDVDSLDNDRLELGVSYRRRLGRRVRLQGAGALKWRSYEEKFPVGEDGEDVIGGPAQSYRYREAGFELEWDPLPGKLRKRMEVELSWKLEDREDLYRGMLDRERRRAGLEVRADLPRGIALELDLSRQEKDYDRYHVLGDPSRPLLNIEETDVELSAELPLGSFARLELLQGLERSRSTYWLYEYEEWRSQAMVAFRF